MTITYIGLGSNLAEGMNSPKDNITTAIKSIARIQSTRIMRVSSPYKSKPVGPQDQNDYINAVAQLETGLMALELLNNLQAIENEHGRVRDERWGPRTLDLDILIYGDEQVQNEDLTIQHVEMLNRAFVLIPLAEISPDCVIPGAGLIINYLQGLDRNALEILN